MTKADGTRVTVKLDKNLKVIKVEDGMGWAWATPRRRAAVIDRVTAVPAVRTGRRPAGRRRAATTDDLWAGRRCRAAASSG